MLEVSYPFHHANTLSSKSTAFKHFIFKIWCFVPHVLNLNESEIKYGFWTLVWKELSNIKESFFWHITCIALHVFSCHDFLELFTLRVIRISFFFSSYPLLKKKKGISFLQGVGILEHAILSLWIQRQLFHFNLSSSELYIWKFDIHLIHLMNFQFLQWYIFPIATCPRMWALG